MQKEKTKIVILSILNVLEYTDQIYFLNLHHWNVARIWSLHWSVFSPIWTEYGDLQSKSPENTYQNILQRLQCFPVNNAKYNTYFEKHLRTAASRQEYNLRKEISFILSNISQYPSRHIL